MIDIKNLDEATLKKAKERTKEQNKVSKEEAKARYVKDLHDSKLRFEEYRNTLKKETDEKLETSGLSQSEIKAVEKTYRRHLSALNKSEKRDVKQIKETYHHDLHHRPFLDVLDAFFSHPPLWVANLVTAVIFIGVFIYFCVSQKIFENSGHGLLSTIPSFLEGLFVPNYELMFGLGKFTFEQSVVYLCLQTFAIAFLGTLFASILAIPFGFLASKKLFGRWSYISTTILILIRTVPEIVFCYIMIMVTGFSPLTGVVVLSIQSIGMIGKMYSDGLDGMDMTFLEAYDSCGSTRFGSIRAGVFPQVMPSFLSTILYRFDLNLRTASILGLVGAGDLGRLILTYSNEHKWAELGALLWGLIVMVVIVDLISTRLRKKLV